MTRAESTAPRLPKRGAIGHKPLMTPPIQIAEATLDLPDLDAVTRLGAAIAAHLEAGDVVALRGDLGAGKTTLARAVLLARGHEGETPSPTFTLVQAYALPGLEVAHFDLYRLTRPEEAYEIGLDEALDEGCVVIEWPERLGEDVTWIAGTNLLTITISELGEARLATVSGAGSWEQRLQDLND